MFDTLGVGGLVAVTAAATAIDVDFGSAAVVTPVFFFYGGYGGGDPSLDFGWVRVRL